MATFQDDDDNEALVKQLGGKPPEVSNTLPVTPPPAATAPATTPPPPAAPTRTPTTASTFQGFTPQHAMEGFDFAREQNTGKSAKDAFAFLSNQAPPPPLQDKVALGQWFDQYIAPGMNDLGHKVTSPAQGDKFGFENWQGKFDVDFGRGAGADGGALAWQVDDGSAQMPANATYKPQMQAAVAPEGASAMDKIRQEIEALQTGAGSPIDTQALMELLQV